MVRTGKATIRDIARDASVSVSTVSRVVRSSGDVSPATRARVLSVVEASGYRPSSLARALVYGHSNAIGLLVSDVANPFYPQLLKGIERAAQRAGYAVLICATEDSADASLRHVRRLIDHGVRGIIHASVGRDEPYVLEAVTPEMSLVFANRRPRDNAYSYVVADNSGGARLLADHLIRNGHRRIGFINGPSWASNAQERLSAFSHQIEDAGGETIVAGEDFTMESAERAARLLMAQADPPTAVVGVNDTIAVEALRVLRELRYRVPEDVVVAGFDAVDTAATRLLELTSVSADTQLMGSSAFQILLRGLRGTLRSPVHKVIPTTLVIRGSTSMATESQLALSGETQ